ncbi:four helix bundle protein [Patescibacteria group bacterium]|nr:four helix bundle protein [Patescibacteria group bacterium]
MFRFENLEIWKLAVTYSDDIYKITYRFPKDELFGLTSQLRRAVISISANIAEGSGSDSRNDFKKFLNYAIRSNVEVISELFIARQREFISQEEFNYLYEKGEILVKKITAFKNKL